MRQGNYFFITSDRWQSPAIFRAGYIARHCNTRIEDKLTPQIDFAPTVPGLLNLSYKSKFYGFDISKMPKQNGRLFMGSYQNIAYARNNKIVVRSPQQKIEMFNVDFITGAESKIPLEDSLVNEGIAYYKTASYLFKNGLYEK